ncbi:MAG: type II toxin-antitoxin system RelE/ParE family toxin [Alphaproteobacteria bacterium]
MKIIWRLTARNDLTGITDYIAEDNPRAARFVEARIYRAIGRLENFPNSGRPGIVVGTREIVVPGFPYIVVYTHESDTATIIAVVHGAQDRP